MVRAGRTIAPCLEAGRVRKGKLLRAPRTILGGLSRPEQAQTSTRSRSNCKCQAGRLVALKRLVNLLGRRHSTPNDRVWK
jgi:hypothetical protein